MGYLIGQLVPPPTDPIVANALEAASQSYSVPVELLTSVAYHESRYKTDALNRESGAAGMMQLMPATAKALNVDPYNPVQAADGAARLLRRWYKRFDGSWGAALAAYVWGPARVERARKYDMGEWPQEVKDYVARVMEGAGFARPFSFRLQGELK